jgi:hypothetical protein
MWNNSEWLQIGIAPVTFNGTDEFQQNIWEWVLEVQGRASFWLYINGTFYGSDWLAVGIGQQLLMLEEISQTFGSDCPSQTTVRLADARNNLFIWQSFSDCKENFKMISTVCPMHLSFPTLFSFSFTVQVIVYSRLVYWVQFVYKQWTLFTFQQFHNMCNSCFLRGWNQT